MTLNSLPAVIAASTTLSRFLEAPAVSTRSVGNDGQIPSVLRREDRCAATDLGGGTQLAPDEDHVVLGQSLIQQPVHRVCSLGVHVGNERRLVVGLVGIDEPVKEEHRDAGVFCGLQDVVPSGSVRRRDQEIVDAIADVPLRRRDLLAVVPGVGLPGGVAIRL
jgi:hypothetical protein